MRTSIPQLSLFFALIILGCESKSNNGTIVMRKDDLMNYLTDEKNIDNIEISDNKGHRLFDIITIIPSVISSQLFLFIIYQCINKRKREEESTEKFIQLVVSKGRLHYNIDASAVLWGFNARGKKLKKIASSEEIRNYFKKKARHASEFREEMEWIIESVVRKEKNEN